MMDALLGWLAVAKRQEFATGSSLY